MTNASKNGEIETSDLTIHFIGFRGDEYWSAVKIWGYPHFIHRNWDIRARIEIADGDIAIFAKGSFDDEPSVYSFDDSSVM